MGPSVLWAPPPAEFFVLASGEYTGILGPLLLACEKYKLDPVQSKPSLLTTRRLSIPGEAITTAVLDLEIEKRLAAGSS
jgi:hypothetical protein